MFTPHFNAFRFYDDDAGEAASTQLAAQDTNHTLNADSDVAFQLRVRIDETGGVDGGTGDDYRLLYDKNGVGAVVLTTTDTGTGIRAVAAGLTNDNATTNRSSDPISDPGSGSFVAGEQCTDGLLDDMQLTANNFTEHAFGIEIVSANVVDTDFFDFSFDRPNPLVNNVTPRITISKGAGANEESELAGLLLADSDERGTGLFARDPVLLGENIRGDRDMTSRDLLFLNDSFALAIAHTVRDFVLLGETSAADVIRTIFNLDGLLLADTDLRDISLLALDPLLLDARRESELSRYFIDRVFLDSSQIVEAISEIVVSAIDGLLLDDRRLSEVDKRIAETILVADQATRLLDSLLRDTLLLGETTIAEINRDVFRTDGVLLLARARSLVVRQVIDSLLLIDRPLKDRDLAVRDAFLLGDRERKERELVARDSLFLGDRELRESVRAVIDNILLRSEQSTEVSLSRTDSLLIGDAARRALDILVREGFEIGDTGATFVTESGPQLALTFALLRFRDMLGSVLRLDGNRLGSALGFTPTGKAA